jgi:hypothetical protein
MILILHYEFLAEITLRFLGTDWEHAELIQIPSAKSRQPISSMDLPILCTADR